MENRIRDYVNGKVKLQRFIELQDFNYDTVKLEVTKDGETRTVDLNRLKMRGFHNISASVERDKNGNRILRHRQRGQNCFRRLRMVFTFHRRKHEQDQLMASDLRSHTDF